MNLFYSNLCFFTEKVAIIKDKTHEDVLVAQFFMRDHQFCQSE